MSGQSDRMARRYAATDRWVTRVLGGARGVFEGVWLGMLDRDALAAIDTIHYDRAQIYQDRSYNLRGLWPWEANAVSRYFPPGGRVIVTGAGGGREVLALLAAGFDADGYEPNAGLVAVGARLTDENGYGVRVHVSQRDEWPHVGGGVDAVIAGWGAYMLIPSRGLRRAYLEGARQTLRPGGPILLSFFAREGASLRHRVAARVGTGVRAVRRLDAVEVGDSLEPNFRHYFSRAQIESELSDGGFQLDDYGTDDYGWAVGCAR